jgi:hypothetical protein
MPYLVIARRVQGRWRVEPCPGCRRVHQHASTGQQTARCGTTYVVVATNEPTSIRAGITPPDDGPEAA